MAKFCNFVTLLFITASLWGCTDPVDTYLDAIDARIHIACDCVPIIAFTSSSEECYSKLGISSVERECVHTVVEKDSSAKEAISCRTHAEEQFTSCLNSVGACDIDTYSDCEDIYQNRTEDCPNFSSSAMHDIDQCLD